jgi:4-alpha-glucanotransferase
LPGFNHAPIDLARSSGIQLHPTSLPSGRLDEAAYRFIDWLSAAGQSWWQMLPLAPPDRYGSPYRGRSAFACHSALLADPRAPVSAGEEADFRARHSFWIDDWVRACGGSRRALQDQVRFEREWRRLRSYAADRGVRLIGDLPMYVGAGSADHRLYPEIFQRDAVAGAPPDDYTAAGQRWGNPLYDWPALRRRRYRWWVERLGRAIELFDVVRLDHFRGFVAYWSIPASARSAAAGRWRRGPGRAPLDAAGRAIGRLPLIAEDLGAITEPVRRLRRELGLPGMVVLQFTPDPAATARDRVLYTGTHDHDTLLGWWRSLDGRRRTRLEAALRRRGLKVGEPHWALIRFAFAAPPVLAIAQLQDVLGLGSEARMNVPGRASGNWTWRLQHGMTTAALARRLRAATVEAGRLP